MVCNAPSQRTRRAMAIRALVLQVTLGMSELAAVITNLQPLFFLMSRVLRGLLGLNGPVYELHLAVIFLRARWGATYSGSVNELLWPWKMFAGAVAAIKVVAVLPPGLLPLVRMMAALAPSAKPKADVDREFTFRDSTSTSNRNNNSNNGPRTHTHEHQPEPMAEGAG